MTPRPKPPETERPTKDASEYDRFEALTKKLVKVPKSEIDAEREKENGAKPSTRRK